MLHDAGIASSAIFPNFTRPVVRGTRTMVESEDVDSEAQAVEVFEVQCIPNTGERDVSLLSM